ncbi:MAG: plasmid stabilization protein [Rhodanobacter sp.]|nr:MAG: plasmid stabilization protein [Rhodanobacter sp.]TAM39168.1 MAG: plasmid stabilization protein [Rhodanobacter sp.]
MPFRLIFPEPYRKREKRFLGKHPDVRQRYFKTLLLLEQDPSHPSLRLHALQGRLAGLHSVSISMRYRITLELELREQEIVFVHVGSHGDVY